MVKLYTCILALVMFTATLASTHNEHEHLSLEFVQNEATRLTLLEAYSVYRKIENNKEAVKIIINKHNKIMENAPDKEEGKRIWKNVYEESLADDIDRAIIAQHVCNALHGPAEKCDVGIQWDHKYETRDPTLAAEFHKEVDETIEKVIEKAKKAKDL